MAHHCGILLNHKQHHVVHVRDQGRVNKCSLKAGQVVNRVRLVPGGPWTGQQMCSHHNRDEIGHQSYAGAQL